MRCINERDTLLLPINKISLFKNHKQKSHITICFSIFVPSPNPHFISINPLVKSDLNISDLDPKYPTRMAVHSGKHNRRIAINV
jgi:hypothetical protein